MIVVDDHLVRDLVAGELEDPLFEAGSDVATTNLWLFRLARAFTREDGTGALSASVTGLGAEAVARFRRQLVERFSDVVTVVPMEDIAWSMAELQERHRQDRRPLSTAMVEALAAARHLDASIAVAEIDVGPMLRAAAEADGVPFHVIER